MRPVYNRYIPASAYTKVGPERREPNGGAQARAKQTGAGVPAGLLRFLGGKEKNAGIAGILRALHLEELDSGDILLLLIILFLILEGDDLEMVITLGLMLLLSLGDAGKENGQKE